MGGGGEYLNIEGRELVFFMKECRVETLDLPPKKEGLFKRRRRGGGGRGYCRRKMRGCLLKDEWLLRNGKGKENIIRER
jgi:hypothetical protein